MRFGTKSRLRPLAVRNMRNGMTQPLETTLAPDDWTELRYEQAYCAGNWLGSRPNERIDIQNPSTGEVIGSVPCLGIEEARDAIIAARAAQPAWQGLLPRQRGDVLMRWHDLLMRHRRQLAALMTKEQGKPLADAIGEIEYGASFIRWFAEEASRLYGEVIPSHLSARRLFVQREALGVVGLITPWNFPSAMLARKAAAALAAGCSAVAVPSVLTPFSALALAALGEKAGLPPGIFSVLTGNPAVLGGELCRNDGVRGISFTGSTEVGRLLMAQCAPSIKRLSLELGGHAPFIVFSDVDVESAAKAAAEAKYQTGGQDCLAANRIFVHRSIYQGFLDAFVRAAKSIRVGDGFDQATDMGPLINRQTLAKSEAHVADAVGKGARLLTGGRRLPQGELFYEPTVLADVTSEMKIMHEETFGPVAAITAFDEEAEVLAAANNTEYGLVAYVFTSDLSRSHRVSDALEYGMVAVNTVKLTGAPIPFGGIKQSGIGREGSRYGLDEFTTLKYVCTAV
ncbi:NAD-dependent succinate-semialdehyde dehydrogenase [Bradyrhizobium mercantei]|uniref:NAD-dependent succinate-semialdehyde dehydrogenase n=1 Tax=Bradyrhizobium mercantei TaxID=1904807 RepID=UPI001FDA7D72|nr:NAD-dependent succinate-semialdehyde dehydrogenase [Bradyrhizobium mercantei]